MNDGLSLKEKLKQNRVTVGSWITIGHPTIAEVMARSGFDWLTIDMEHSPITLNEAQELIRTIDLCQIAPLVRVGSNDANLIKRVMDAGAHGVIVPMVNSEEDAKRAVAAVRYPPRGFRGVGLSRAQGYGYGFEEYKVRNENQSVVIVQIEHIQAVENMEAILAVDGVDGFLVGPYDLSASLGIPGEFEHPDMLKALDKILQIKQSSPAAPGFHVIPPEADRLREKIDEGYRFIGFSLDFLFLGSACRDPLSSIGWRV